MAGKALDLSEIVRREKDGSRWSALDEFFDEFVAHKRVKAGNRLIEKDERGPVSQGTGEGRLHPHAATEMLEFAEAEGAGKRTAL